MTRVTDFDEVLAFFIPASLIRHLGPTHLHQMDFSELRHRFYWGDYHFEYEDPSCTKLSVVMEREYLTLTAYDDTESRLILSSRDGNFFSFRVSGTGSRDKWAVVAKMLSDFEEELCEGDGCALKFFHDGNLGPWDKALFEGVEAVIHLVSTLKVENCRFKRGTLPREIDSIIGFTALHQLDISHTNLKEFPAQLPENLVLLVLIDNAISVIPRTVLELCDLEQLIICDNPIREAPSFLVLLPSLRELLIDPRGFVPDQIEVAKPRPQSVDDMKDWDELKDYFEYLETWEFVVKDVCKKAIPMPIFDEIVDHIVQERWLRE